MKRPIRSLWRAWRAKRRYNRGELDQNFEAMLGQLDAPFSDATETGDTTMKPITQSATTATVAGAAASSGGAIYGVIAFLRSAFPDYMPFGPESDAAVVVVVTTVLTPLLSRLVASIRKGG